MRLSLFRANVDVTEHPLMERTVPIACANMAFVPLIPQHHIAQAIMVADVQHRVSVLGFCVICAIRSIRMRLAKATVNPIFLGQNVKKYAMQIYRMTTQTKFVKPCARQAVNAILVTVMEHVTTVNANATNTGTMTTDCNVRGHVPELLFAPVMVPVHYLEIIPDVFARMDGTVQRAICHVPVCWKPMFHATTKGYATLILITTVHLANVLKSIEETTVLLNVRVNLYRATGMVNAMIREFVPVKPMFLGRCLPVNVPIF